MKLKIAQALEEDIGKNFVRIEEKYYKDIKIEQGEWVEIIGSKKAIARAEVSYPGDAGLGLVRMDRFTRNNAGAHINDEVEIRKAELKDAEEILLAPADNINIAFSQKALQKYFIGHPTIKGCILRMRSVEDGFDKMMSITNKFLSLDGMQFMVKHTSPSGPVMITKNTKIILDSECSELERLRLENQVLREKIAALEEEGKI